MQRPIAFGREQTVRLHHGDHIMMFDGNLEIMEADVFKHARFLHGGRNQRFRRRTAIFCIQFLIERARVHADAQRDARIGGGLADGGTNLIEFTNVARIHAYRGTARIDSLKHVFALKMNIGDYRDRRFLHDFRQRVGIILVWHGHAHDVASGCGQLGNLL